MKFMLSLAAIPAAALAVVACSQEAEPAPEPAAEPTETGPELTPETVTDADCGADKLQDYKGQMLTDKMFRDILEDYPLARAYPQGGSPALDQNFNGERVNLVTDDYRNILEVRCF